MKLFGFLFILFCMALFPLASNACGSGSGPPVVDFSATPTCVAVGGTEMYFILCGEEKRKAQKFVLFMEVSLKQLQ